MKSVSQKRILVVEDDLDIQEYFSFLFRSSNVDLVFAASADEALEKIESKTHIDLVLLDLVLPDRPGEDVLEMLSREHGTKLPVILSSVDQVRAERLKSNGSVKGIFKKGAPGEQLLAMVSEVLG